MPTVLPIPAGTEVSVRKTQRRQRGVARAAVREFPLGPRDETAALVFEQRGEVGAGAGLAQHGFLLGADVEVDERQVDLVHPELLAHQVPVDAQLGPGQAQVIVGDARELAAVRLDLFDQVAVGVVAVGPSAHVQRAPVARQRHFAAVVVVAAGCHDGMARDAFLRRG